MSLCSASSPSYTGSVSQTIPYMFNRCGRKAEPEPGASLPHQYSLMADRECQERVISGRLAPDRFESDRSFTVLAIFRVALRSLSE